ncbi:MAG: histidinol-phosphate transaminase, partial [Pirellulaceae bacterium]
MSIRKIARADLWGSGGYPSSGGDREEFTRLNCNENPWAPLRTSDPLINRYPEKQPSQLVDRLASLYNIAPTNLIITRGADDGIDAIIRGFCQPGVDAIAQCPPAFVMYSFFAKLHGAAIHNVHLDAANAFAVDFDSLAESVNEGAKILFLCSPNNPTGSSVDRERIIELCGRVSDRAVVVVDEAYVEFADAASLSDRIDDLGNLIVLRTLSKAWSLAGARLGVIIASDEITSYLHATISPYPLSRSATRGALDATSRECMATAATRIESIKSQRDKVAEALRNVDWIERVYPSQANFLLVKVPDAQALMQFARENGFLLRD